MELSIKTRSLVKLLPTNTKSARDETLKKKDEDEIIVKPVIILRGCNAGRVFRVHVFIKGQHGSKFNRKSNIADNYKLNKYSEFCNQSLS